MFGFVRRKGGGLFDALFRTPAATAPEPVEADGVPVLSLSALLPSPLFRNAMLDGSKFDGGYGATELLTADYWTLRARSSELFEKNLYARGLIRRLVTNEINTGLHLEAVPEESILGLEEDSLSDWAENVENRFKLWSDEPRICDQSERSTFGALQAQARMEALICGDVLVVLRQDQRTGLPRVQLVSGSTIQNPYPMPTMRAGTRIEHGVEIDPQGRHVAFWIRQRDATSKRLPAFGEKSGRRLAWLVYGTDKRLDDVRGKPILSLVLQSLKEIDRYRDSTQRKAVINSMLAMFITKGQDKPGTRPITGGAQRRTTVESVDAAGVPHRTFQAEHIPGIILEELQHGETPQAFTSSGTDERFGTFEEAIIQAVAWANEVPPEILRLAFSSNYAASQAAINEFKMYLNKVRTLCGETFNQLIYNEWLISEVLAGKIIAPGLLEAWRDPKQYDIYGAWISSDWAGHIKPAVDLSKLVRGYNEMIKGGLITRDRASRELTGTKYSKNVKKLRRENLELAEANGILADLEARAKQRLRATPGDGVTDVPDNDDNDAEDNDDAQAKPASAPTTREKKAA